MSEDFAKSLSDAARVAVMRKDWHLSPEMQKQIDSDWSKIFDEPVRVEPGKEDPNALIWRDRDGKEWPPIRPAVKVDGDGYSLTGSAYTESRYPLHTWDNWSSVCGRCGARREEIDDAMAPTECMGDRDWRTAWKEVAALRAQVSQMALDMTAQQARISSLAAERNQQAADAQRLFAEKLEWIGKLIEAEKRIAELTPKPEPTAEEKRAAALTRAFKF